MAARKLRLTPRKQQWADRFKPKALKGAPLRQSVMTATRYDARLQRLVDEMVRTTTREVEKLFRSPTAVESHVMTTDASIASQSRILMNGLINRFTVLFSQAARGLSESMVNEVQKDSATGLNRSLKEISGGLALKTDVLKSGPVADVAKASVAENVNLIKSIPQQYLDKVNGAVMRSITSGNGLQDLQPFLEEQEGVTKRRAKNIALDQTRKAFNSINRARMESVGVGSFEWIHSGGGQKPRPEHIEMSGNVYRFDDLPVIDPRTGERGIPGQAPNCRCTMRPVLDFGEG